MMEAASSSAISLVSHSRRSLQMNTHSDCNYHEMLHDALLHGMGTSLSS